MGVLEYVAALLLAVGVAWLLANIGHYRTGPVDWLSEGLAWMVRGWRHDPWPRGVQEEDRDRPWGRPPSPARPEQSVPPEPPPPVPALVRVRPAVRRR